MAPFAFLGQSEDDALREFYTTTRSRDIFVLGDFLRPSGNCCSAKRIADTGPLAALIERHVDDDFLREIAEAHQRGRRLYIGTADLDSQRFMVWNMGLIATSGRPEALALFRQVMLASASIPVAFSPVFFEVEAGGRRYDEMHVDGGVGARVFLNGGVFSAASLRERGGLGNGHAGHLRDPQRPTGSGAGPDPPLGAGDRPARDRRHRPRRGAGRPVSHLRMRAADGAGFHWVTIPNDVSMKSDEVFDPVAMNLLYDVGYRLGATGDAWATSPPGALRNRCRDGARCGAFGGRRRSRGAPSRARARCSAAGSRRSR